MASAWGVSWGSAWGVSWDFASVIVVEPPRPNVGGSISGGTFTRGKWRKLQALLAAEKVAANPPAQALRAVAKRKLITAVKVARQIEVVTTDEGRQITLALDAAFGAGTLAEVIRHSDVILSLAKQSLQPKLVNIVSQVVPFDSRPKPTVRRKLRVRPKGKLSALDAVTYDIEAMLEDHRVTMKDRGNWRKYKMGLYREKLANDKAEAKRKRDETNLTCQLRISEAIDDLMKTLTTVH